MTIIKQFTVEIDAATGEWLGEPEYVGMVDKAEWDAKTDTDEAHFDTFERDDQTCAVECVYVS